MKDNIGVILAIVALYALWQSVRESLGFRDFSAGQIIAQLQAEDIVDRSRDSASAASLFDVKELAEANTIMLCSIAPEKLKYNPSMPCKRLLRERGLE